MGLSFLNKVIVKDEVKQSVRLPKDKGPADGSDLRVYYNGAVYPSEAFAKAFNLEFQNKEVVTIPGKDGEEATTELKYGPNPGMALDIFKASEYPAVKSEDDFIMITAVPRTSGKTDLFKGCEYNTDGTPKAIVTAQGSTTFGKEVLLPMLKEAYDIDLDKEKNPYVDLKVVGSGESFNEPWINSNGTEVYNIPKRYTRGQFAGQATYVRRENLLLWALVPTAMTADLPPVELNGPTYLEIALSAGVEVDADGDDEGDVNGAESADLAEAAEAFAVPD
jgi:hypothetical protein